MFRLSLFSFLLVFQNCALLKSIESPSSEYQAYLESRIAEAQLYDRGRGLVSVKALFADESLYQEQIRFTPGFSFPYDSASEQIIVAIDMTTWERFSTKDLEFVLNEVSMLQIREIVNPVEIESHYPFAHPHYRVFVAKFPPGVAREKNRLQIRTLRGAIVLSLEKRGHGFQ